MQSRNKENGKYLSISSIIHLQLHIQVSTFHITKKLFNLNYNPGNCELLFFIKRKKNPQIIILVRPKASKLLMTPRNCA